MSRKQVDELTSEEELPVFVEVEQGEEGLVSLDLLEAEPEESQAPDEEQAEEASSSEEEVEAAAKEASTLVSIVYRGEAHSLSFGPYTFRPGEPATLPSSVAEELLTLPYEQFEVKE